MLIRGIPQVVSGLRSVISPSLSDPVGTQAGRLGYLSGALVMSLIAFFLVRFGLRRFQAKS
jgi:hypothetical protein